MTKTYSTRVTSKTALLMAVVCVAGTFGVLFDDVIRGGAFNINHLMALVVLAATMYGGHAMLSRFKTHPFACIMAGVIFLAGTSVIVITSAGRTSHVMQDKQLAAADANAKYNLARDRVTAAQKAYKTAQDEAAAQCKTGAGPRCRGANLTTDKAGQELAAALAAVKDLKPANEASDYLQAADLIAAIYGGERKAIEAKLSLVVPFLLAVITEIGCLVFSSLAVERVVVEAVVTKQETALTFERPITETEKTELQQIYSENRTKVYTRDDLRRLQSQGLTLTQIALAFDPSGNTNPGRLSELNTGKREFIEVRA